LEKKLASKKMTCKNCDSSFEGKFCSNCGQSSKIDKINLSNFLADLSSSVFQINNGLLFSIKELFVRPGESIRDYLKGKRKNHFKPIAFAFTLSTIYFLVSQVFESQTLINDAIDGWFYSEENKEGLDALQLSKINWLKERYAFVTLLLLPIYALSTFLAFLGTKYNYLEHFILNAFIIGQQAIFYAISITLGYFLGFEDIWVSLCFFTSISYAFFVFWHFFKNQKRFTVLLRSVLAYIIFLLLITPIMAIVFK